MSSSPFINNCPAQAEVFTDAMSALTRWWRPKHCDVSVRSAIGVFYDPIPYVVSGWRGYSLGGVTAGT